MLPNTRKHTLSNKYYLQNQLGSIYMIFILKIPECITKFRN